MQSNSIFIQTGNKEQVIIRKKPFFNASDMDG